MFRIFLTMLTVGVVFTSSAQSTAMLAPDQNPNYLVSQQKYTNHKDSLLELSNTTVQQTYKAYDWYEAREERRAERRAYRRYSSYYDPYYYAMPSVTYSWRNRYSYSPFGNGWGFSRPFIGFRTGNWWFGF